MMIKIFTDKNGAKFDYENFRAPHLIDVVNPEFDDQEAVSESNPETIKQEVPYI